MPFEFIMGTSKNEHSKLPSHYNTRKSKANPNYKGPRKRRSNSKQWNVRGITDNELVDEVIEERNYSRSDSRLICASTGTSKSLILGRCYTELEDSDQEEEFFTYTEVTGSQVLAQEISQSEKTPGDKNGKSLASKKGLHFPFRRSLFAYVPPYIFFHSYDCTCNSGIPKILTDNMKWKLNSWTPQIIRKTVETSGFRIIPNDPSDLESWWGTWDHIYPKNIKFLKFYQKVNHFPGTSKLGHKDQLWTSINEMIKKFGRKHFGFTPSTYILPQDKPKLMSVWNDNAKTKWIIKPPNSGCGVGVHVVHQWWEIPMNSYLVVQRYLARPKLINGAKFDIRLYVLVTSFNPLRVYLYSDGLVRIATTKYDVDVKHHRNRFMHLTNTSINKYSKSYHPSPNVNSTTGHLWSLKSLWCFLEKESVNIPKLWDAMKDIVIKTLISTDCMIGPVIQRTLTSRYSCFELFGFDILIEEDYKPWLLEVNTTPSLQADSAVHRAIKGPLVRTIFNVAGYQVNSGLPNSVLCQLSRRYHPDFISQEFYIDDKNLTHQATRKQFNYMYQNNRDEYLKNILNDLTPDDLRNLIKYEDEITQLELFERIFPTNETHKYLKYFPKPRYYDMLFDAWENAYGSCRYRGIQILQELCKEKYHLIP